MKARPAWVRKLWVILAIGAGLGFLAGVYVYLQLTGDIAADGFKEPNLLDAREADRKLRIYRTALGQAERSLAVAGNQDQ